MHIVHTRRLKESEVEGLKPVTLEKVREKGLEPCSIIK
jgi:hypothetical protein